MGKGWILIKKRPEIIGKNEIAYNGGLEIQIQLLLKELGTFSTEINSYQIAFNYSFNHKRGS